ncbi:MAG: type II secretion system protein [Verrucomicrobiota bacterium]
MRAAFTLVELLVVIAILATLAVFLIGYIGASNEAAKRKSAGVQIAAIETAIENFQTDYGEFPVNDGGPEEGAFVVYQALSGDGNDKLGFPGEAFLSRGRLGSSGEVYLSDLADPRGASVALVSDGGEMYALIDPWANAYRYVRKGTGAERRSAQKNEATYDLWSLGGGEESEEDEENWITNW